jgi:hypothetical protein
MAGAYDQYPVAFGTPALDALAPDLSRIKPDPGTGTSAPIPSVMDDGLYGRVAFFHVNINIVTTAPVLIRQAERRAYLLIQNLSLVNMWIGFGKQPTVEDAAERYLDCWRGCSVLRQHGHRGLICR